MTSKGERNLSRGGALSWRTPLAVPGVDSRHLPALQATNTTLLCGLYQKLERTGACSNIQQQAIYGRKRECHFLEACQTNTVAGRSNVINFTGDTWPKKERGCTSAAHRCYRLFQKGRGGLLTAYLPLQAKKGQL